jgi:hypothetical protein
MTEVVTTPVREQRTVEQLDEGDHERMAHIVDERFGTVVEAIVNGTPCVALCGKVWVPSRDPKRYPICPTCVEEAKARGWPIPTA